MDLVTLAYVTLNRVGSASRAAMVKHREIKVVREVLDASTTSLENLVIAVAVEHGEQLEALHGFRQSKGWSRNGQYETYIFDIQGPNIHYSSCYAECWTSPALKIGGRYFKLDEVKSDTT